MRPGVLWAFYRQHLRERPLQELLALVGIAVGVALIFAVQVANHSITGSVRQLVTGITGSADLQLVARGPQGLDETLYDRVRTLGGVVGAAPVLERRVGIVGPRGRASVDFVGITPDLAELGGSLTRDYGFAGLRMLNGVVVPRPLSAALGVRSGDRLRIESGAGSREVTLSTSLLEQQVGPLVSSPIMAAELGSAQRLLEMPGRITRILVETRAGMRDEVAAALRRVAGPGADVTPADTEARLIEQAAAPNDQSTTLFAAISGVVGLLLALNAMLLTVVTRRRFIASLRMYGYGRGQTVVVIVFQALALGSAASIAGIALGELLSRKVFHVVPGYLSFAFPVGNARVVDASAVAIAVGAGLLGTLLAAAWPLRDLLLGDERGATAPRPELPAGSRRFPVVRLCSGIALLGVATLTLVALPSAIIGGIAALGAATLLLLAPLLDGVLAGAKRVAGYAFAGPLALSVAEIQHARGRSLALAATGALAVFGSVAIEGAHRDLLHGLDTTSRELTHTADLWVASPGTENTLLTASFAPGALGRQVAALPGVRDVREFRGGFVDWGSRRLWLLGRPAGDRPIIPSGQVMHGDRGVAERAIRRGGWVAVSDAVAREHGLRIGGPVALPTPSGPARLRLAARLTNVGWPPGAVIMNSADVRRLWRSDDLNALEVDVEPGVAPAAVAQRIDALVGTRTGIRARSADARWAMMRDNARQGLERLTQISTLVLIAAILAMAAAMGSAVWARRVRLAEYRLAGFSHVQLWAMLSLESLIVLGLGCVLGAAAGVFGQLLLTRWLELSTGFPALFSPSTSLVAGTAALVALAAAIVTTIPGYFAAKPPLRLALGTGE